MIMMIIVLRSESNLKNRCRYDFDQPFASKNLRYTTRPKSLKQLDTVSVGQHPLIKGGFQHFQWRAMSPRSLLGRMLHLTAEFLDADGSGENKPPNFEMVN